MRIHTDGSVSITAADLKAFGRLKKTDGDLVEIGGRINKNADTRSRRRKQAKREVEFYNELAEIYNGEIPADEFETA